MNVCHSERSEESQTISKVPTKIARDVSLRST
jgi:hypothetical protein